MVAQKETGLTASQVKENIKTYGINEIKAHKASPILIFIRQFKGNYLIYLLAICTFVSFLLGERTSSLYILFMILISSVLGFWNEFSAQKVVESLLARLTPKVLVKRDGVVDELLVTQITVGDIVLFSTGSVIPADLTVLQAENLEVNESVLTGESVTITKKPGDSLFMGTNVESGHGVGRVTSVGEKTKYGQIAKNLSFLKPETSFQAGLRNFGLMLVRVIGLIALAVFVVNFGLGKPWLTSLMFALAIAVGLTPEFLPLVVTLSLSHGAGRLAKKHVLVKQLVAVENLGNMDILCCDKTGTLTEGRIELADYFSTSQKGKKDVLKWAFLSCPQTSNPGASADAIEQTIMEGVRRSGIEATLAQITYLDNEPFDYDKKASFNLVRYEGENYLVVKGSFAEVAEMCGKDSQIAGFSQKVENLNRQGYRIVAVARKAVEERTSECTWDDAKDMNFEGILALSDPPRKDAKKALESLAKLNVELKVLTGDSEFVALKVCSDVGFVVKDVILGSDLDKMDEKQLERAIIKANLFARVSPENKLAVIKTLQKLGHTVGFLGDGINDAPSLHAADVGISVNSASAIAKQSASIVLMRKGLDVLSQGVEEGRKIFNNTIKYILMGTSSNFGNMFSASLASISLPFLPMTPVQILLNNTLYDFSQLTIPTDNVDRQSLLKPRHWDVSFIRKYMLYFGPVSSVFDFITFFFLLRVFRFGENQFQAGWFLESLFTQVLVIFIIRSAKFPFFRSKPSGPLKISALMVVLAACLIVLLPIGQSFGFGKLPPVYFVFLVAITTLYLVLVDYLKLWFITKFKVWN